MCNDAYSGGSVVLVNMNEVKGGAAIPSVAFSDAPSPSSNSEPSEGSVERGTPSQSGLSTSGSSSSSVNDQYGDFRMLDFSGVHYAGDPRAFQHAPSFVAAPTTVYGVVDQTIDEHSNPAVAGPPKTFPQQGQGNVQATQHETMYPVDTGFVPQEAHTSQVIALPVYGNVPDMQYNTMNGVTDMSLLNATGYVAHGPEVYDQESWERFLIEMGMPNIHPTV